MKTFHAVAMFCTQGSKLQENSLFHCIVCPGLYWGYHIFHSHDRGEEAEANSPSFEAHEELER